MIDRKQLAIARAIEARKMFGFGTSSSIEILKKFQQKDNYTLVFMPFNDEIDGFSSKHKNHFIIIINSSCSINRQNFTCAHELYHLLYEYDENEEYMAKPESESMANTFASYFLVPEDALYLFLSRNNIIHKNKLDIEDIILIENYFQVSRHAILVRLKDEDLITHEQFEKFSQNVIKSIVKNGHDPKYHIDPAKPKKYTTGEYIDLAKRLYKENKISRGKYEELLIDSFNSDEIFGSAEESDGNKGKR